MTSLGRSHRNLCLGPIKKISSESRPNGKISMKQTLFGPLSTNPEIFDTTKFGGFQYFQRPCFWPSLDRNTLHTGVRPVKNWWFLRNPNMVENFGKCGMNQQNFRLKTFRKRHPTQCRLCKCTRNEQQTSRKWFYQRQIYFCVTG